jgi:hypothetical protein
MLGSSATLTQNGEDKDAVSSARENSGSDLNRIVLSWAKQRSYRKGEKLNGSENL